MVCASNVVCALLSVGGQVAIGQVIAGHTLGSHDASAFENRQGKTWEFAHVDRGGRQTRRRADRIVISEFDVRQMQIAIVLSLGYYHSQHLGHSGIHPLNAPVTVGMMGACSKLAHAQQLLHAACESLAQNYRPLSEIKVLGSPHKGMYWLTRILVVPSAANLAAVAGTCRPNA